MPYSRSSVLGLVAATVTAGALLAVGVPLALAAPNFDSQGYLDSTARCATGTTAVLYGSTNTSRIAICKDSDGTYEYRGVRIRDGAKLVTSATVSQGSGGYIADNSGIEYYVTTKSVVVSSGSEILREESWTDFHEPGQSSTSSTPSTSSSPTTSSSPSTSATPTTSMAPLPAEVGGSGQHG